MRSTPSLLVSTALCAVWLAACAGVKTGATAGTGTGGIPGTGGLGPLMGAAGNPTGGSPPLAGLGGSTGGSIATPPPGCGDGVRGSNEACDDGNTIPNDGCSADCQSVDPGYSCSPAGQPCHLVARCGDGIVVTPELCDDGNTTAGDGCSDTCKIELGWKCSGSPSQCTHTTCGDGKVEGAESCDDGNALPFDGCSADCQVEPDCKTGSCMSRCGDGIVVGEACDDGNNVDGDGCSADCKIEPGFTCTQPPLGDKMLVPALYRDFRAKMPADFEPGATGRTMALTGIVKTTLDSDGKPVYTGNVTNSYITSTTTFAEWYRDTPGVNHSTAGKITLWSNGKGAYVNRYGANGEQWQVTTTAYYCGNVGEEQTDPTTGMAIPCTSKYAAPGSTDCEKDDALGYTRLSCNVSGGSYTGTYLTGLLDGTPLFFPVDGDNFTPVSERVSATIAPPYDPNYSAEAGKPLHNFSFTSEVRYWFQYDSTKTYTLDFTGDDDVWLFINRQLAVDLGGIHTPVQGSVTFGAGMPAKFGLTNGQVYEVVVFQAERQTTGSTYRLTLSGFNAGASQCTPTCGDGIVSIGEECDDGTAKNTGGYGQCGPDCKLGPYCGDGIVQPEYEDCDTGMNANITVDGTKPCPSGCRYITIDKP
jgi:fibro-slime domain-containing protein